MPTEDGVDPGHPMAHSLADDCQKWVRSHFLKASIFVIVAIVSGIAITRPSTVKPVRATTASLADASLLPPDAIQVMPTTARAAAEGSSNESSAAVTSNTAASAPAHDEIAAVPEVTGPSRIKHTEDSSEALFAQFQAWAATQPKLAQPQPVQSAPAVQNALASAEQGPEVKSAQTAQPEIRAIRRRRQAKMQRDQVQRPKTQVTKDAQAQEPVQNAPSFLQSLGLQK